MIFRAVFLAVVLGVGSAVALELTFITPGVAVAGFSLISATPYDRQVVSPAPVQYTLRFAQPVRPDRSFIKVLDAYGMRVNGEELASDGMSITTALPVLAPGKYTVRWQAECQCDAGTVVSDSYRFFVK